MGTEVLQTNTTLAEKSEEEEQLGETCRYPRNETHLSPFEHLTLEEELKITRALGRLSSRFQVTPISQSMLKETFVEFEDAFSYYLSQGWEQRPEEFFSRPENDAQVCLATPVPLSRGEVLDLSFRSNFNPTYAPFQEVLKRSAENRTVHARYWRHPAGESLGTVIAIHGWMMGDNRLSAVTLVPGFFYRLGLDVVVYELPYHGRRAIRGVEQEDSLFPSVNVARTNEGFAQAIYDLRSIHRWLTKEHNLPIGTVGLSLGGHTAALWASLDPLDFVICAAPLVSLAHLVWDTLLDPESECALLERGVTREALEQVYRVSCPLSYAPQVALERRLILAGLSDAIIPPIQPQMLWEHWQKPRIHWLSSSHLGHIVEANTLQKVHDFLLGLGRSHQHLLDIKAR